jgi:hypothetical protein
MASKYYERDKIKPDLANSTGTPRDLDKAGMDEHAIQFAPRARDADVANIGWLKAGDVVLWASVFIDEMVRFPYHAFDDQVGVVDGDPREPNSRAADNRI